MRRTIIIPLLLAFGLFAAACGGTDSDAGVASLESDTQSEQAQEADSDSVSQEEAVMAFTVCLRDEGLDVDDPIVDDQGNLRPPRIRDIESVDHEIAEVAFESCGEYLEDVTFGLESEDRTEREDELLAFAACVRENGYDMPDPDFSKERTPGQGGGGPFGALDREDPAFQTALAACSDIFGAGAPIPGTGGGGQG
ncbi:MAG: hypothetical protein U9N79_10650 [Actinomycetota bacterium]|nr:hypothetical protein [Actinomycetota bacterium]